MSETTGGGTSGFVTTDDGCRLFYRIDGKANAPVLLLSNSLGTNMAMWDVQLSRFAQDFRVIRYDARGHGASDVDEKPYAFARLGMDALAVLDALGIARASFCGLSMGGMVGQWLGVHAGGRFDRLVLANTSAFMPPPEMWNARIATVRERGIGAVVDAVIARWFRPGFCERQPAQVSRIAAMLQTTSATGYAAACAAIRDMDQRAGLSGIGVPALVIVGTHDMATPPQDGEAIAASIPGATVARLDAAHLSNIEQPEAFATQALAFVNAGETR
jgi:3-oxoadipate enol-lactonase